MVDTICPFNIDHIVPFKHKLCYIMFFCYELSIVIYGPYIIENNLFKLNAIQYIMRLSILYTVHIFMLNNYHMDSYGNSILPDNVYEQRIHS